MRCLSIYNAPCLGHLALMATGKLLYISERQSKSTQSVSDTSSTDNVVHYQAYCAFFKISARVLLS